MARKCKATVDGENYVVNCDQNDDTVIIEDNTDGIGGDQNGADGSDTGTEFGTNGSGSGSASGSADCEGSGSGSGCENSGSPDPIIDDDDDDTDTWEGKAWKLPLLIILIVLLVCAILACLLVCVVCKKNKDEVQYVEADEAR